MRLEHFKRALCVCLALEHCLVMDRQAGRWDGRPLAAHTLHLWQPVGPLCGMFRQQRVAKGRGGRRGGRVRGEHRSPRLACSGCAHMLQPLRHWEQSSEQSWCHCYMTPGRFLARQMAPVASACSNHVHPGHFACTRKFLHIYSQE